MYNIRIIIIYKVLFSSKMLILNMVHVFTSKTETCVVSIRVNFWCTLSRGVEKNGHSSHFEVTDKKEILKTRNCLL